MDTRASWFTLILCLGLAGWLYADLSNVQIDYKWHSFLVNSTTGQKIDPREIYDLAKIINVTDEYVNATNAMERLYDLEYNTNMENPFALDQVYSDALQLIQSGWPVSNQTKCGQDLKWILDQLNAHPDYPLTRGKLGMELTQFMDSYGKPESGSFSGLVTWVGSYTQCKRASLDGGSIGARYCTAKMRPKWWPKEESAHPKTRIRVGICLPESCDTMSFKRHHQAIDTLIKFDLISFYRDNLEFESMFCLPDERSPIRQLPEGGRIFLSIVGGWLTLVVVASIVYELIRRRLRKREKESLFINFNQEFEAKKGITVNGFLGRGIYDPSQWATSNELSYQKSIAQTKQKESLSFKILEALSIHYSLKNFKTNTYAKQQESSHVKGKARVNLCCLSSVKFVMAIVVVLAHSCYLNSVYSRGLNNKVEMSVGKAGNMILSFSKCVDTFFIFFGMLTSYTILRKFNIKQLSNPLVWLGINAGIMSRIAPVFMLIYWYAKLVSPYLGDGPWWDYGVYKYSMRGNCQSEPWWTSILYFSRSGLRPATSCLLPGWFLICYSQLALIIPMIVYILYKLPNHVTRYLLMVFAILISSLQFALKAYRQKSIREEAFSMYGAFLVNMIEKFESVGTMSTLSRVGCIVISCYFGYLLRQYELGEIREWPRWFRSRLSLVIVLILHVVVIFMPLIGHYFAQYTRHMVSLDEFVGSYLLMSVLWPVLNGMLIINGVTYYNRTAVVRFMGHSFWHSANKLGFCIYLVHWEVIFFGVTGFDYSPSMGFISDILKIWSYGVFFSVLLAFFIHILFEAPLANLVLLTAKHSQKQHQTKSIC